MQPTGNDIENSLYMFLKASLIKSGWCVQVAATHDGTVASNQVYVDSDLSAYNPSIVWSNGVVVGSVLNSTLTVSYGGGQTIATVVNHSFADTDLVRYGYYADGAMPQYDLNGVYYDIDIVTLNSLQKDITAPGTSDTATSISVPVIGIKSSEPLDDTKMGLGDLDRWQKFVISIVVIAASDSQRAKLTANICYLLKDVALPVRRWFMRFPPVTGDPYTIIGDGIFFDIVPLDRSIPDADDWGQKWVSVVNADLFLDREAGSGL